MCIHHRVWKQHGIPHAPALYKECIRLQSDRQGNTPSSLQEGIMPVLAGLARCLQATLSNAPRNADTSPLPAPHELTQLHNSNSHSLWRHPTSLALCTHHCNTPDQRTLQHSTTADTALQTLDTRKHSQNSNPAPHGHAGQHMPRHNRDNPQQLRHSQHSAACDSHTPC